MKMIVLVTGASGILGRQLCAFLSHRGHTVVAAGHRSRMDGLPLTIERVNIELANPHSVQAVVQKSVPDVIIHAAALTSTTVCQESPDQATEVNVQGTINLLEAAESLESSPHFVQLSTDLVFDGTKGSPYQEGDRICPIQVYGQTKARAEEVVSSPTYSGLVTILRSALILAQPFGHRPGLMDWTLDSIRSGNGLFFQDEYRTPVFIDDLCRAIDRSIQDGIGGLFHLGGRDRLSRVSLAREVARAFRLPEENIRSVYRADSGPQICDLRPADVSLDSQRAANFLAHDPEPIATILARMAKMVSL